jgi:hypothetical protein
MAKFTYDLGRRTIFFSDHALDRWWERCRENEVHGRQEALDLLKQRLSEGVWTTSLPPWNMLNVWHQARAEGFIELSEESGFVVNKNPSRDLVAVTYIEREEKHGYR